MKVYRSVKSLAREIRRIKKQDKSIGLVPTMGFLHQGHLSLIRKAKKENDFIVVSIFVNPAQFGPKEDFRKYPRDAAGDLALCGKEGVDAVFAPSPKDMYPEGYRTYVNVEGLSGALCGASRPGHFRGVATVVIKLFNIAGPDAAYFGQKDAQQAIVIKRMARDLNIPVRIKVMPTVREKDGLAMSSRNAYLDAKGREDALCLHESLKLAKGLFDRGEREPARIIKKMREVIKRNKRAEIEYISIVDQEGLGAVDRARKGALIALAVRVGGTRLIDNIVLN
ncbi:MAG: pantoate--beta-alanine ligase [Candidatus Omnitrophota bacterium]